MAETLITGVFLALLGLFIAVSLAVAATASPTRGPMAATLRVPPLAAVRTAGDMITHSRSLSRVTGEVLKV